MTATTQRNDLANYGFTLLRNVFPAGDMTALASRLAMALEADEPGALRSRGAAYGSRDLLSLLPEIGELPRQPMLREFLHQVLGPQVGLVRVLFFDKPPESRWSLPWHKDRTIAVKRNDLPSSQFRKPTMKAGIPHVEAPPSLLARMVTLRLHLDAMTADNGPLSVIPGSHELEVEPTAAPVEIHAAAGDVLAMRPLLSHSSSLPREGCTAHRRIIHLEFAPSENLADGYAWHAFHAVG